MTLLHRRPALRWLVPLLLALGLTVGITGVAALSANAGDKLAPRSASRLLVDVQKAQVHGLSGTIVQNADLGLPSLPGVGGAGSSDLSSMISGSHTLRLWYAGPNRVRLSLLGTLGESDVVRNGTDLWTWSSKDKSATHRTVPPTASTAPGLTGATPVSPQQAADEALKAITPSTSVTTDGTATVAGRSAYELLLTPGDPGSLVGSVRIAIDAKTRVPTRVQVFAKGAGSPAVEVGFTSFDPTTPSSSVFRFNPPPGTKVTQAGTTSSTGGATGGRAPTLPGTQAGQARDRSAAPRVVGEGWTAVVTGKAPLTTSGGTSNPAGSLGSMLKALPRVRGGWGSGHLLSSALFSAVITDDGRFAVGAVPPGTLYAALGR